MEKKIAFLRHVSGHTYDTVYDLLFTTERMLALIVWYPGDVPVKFGMMEMLISGQFTKRGERMAKIRLVEERRRLHEEKHPDELVGLHRLNFEIPYGTAASIEVNRGLIRSCLNVRIAGPSHTERTIRFRLAKAQTGEAQKLVGEVLGRYREQRP